MTLTAKLGMSPIAWWNDDLAELSDDVSLEECLRQSRSAGFTGMELGRRFPQTAAEMLPILKAADVTLCGGWFSGTLSVDGDLAAHQDRIAPMIELFRAVDAPCIVYGETGGSVQGLRDVPLAKKPVLSDAEMADYGRLVSDFAAWCAGQGMPLAYHHHMGTVVQDEFEIDRLMAASDVPLLFDAGHLAMARGDVMATIDRHHARITHVHTKDVRRAVTDALDFQTDSFLEAVIRGAFTVPGDGDLDFGAIVQRLADHGYEGWFVVEAEQDPRTSPPQRMAEVGHAELMRVMRAAGYQVVA